VTALVDVVHRGGSKLGSGRRLDPLNLGGGSIPGIRAVVAFGAEPSVHRQDVTARTGGAVWPGQSRVAAAWTQPVVVSRASP